MSFGPFPEPDYYDRVSKKDCRSQFRKVWRYGWFKKGRSLLDMMLEIERSAMKRNGGEGAPQFMFSWRHDLETQWDIWFSDLRSWYQQEGPLVEKYQRERDEWKSASALKSYSEQMLPENQKGNQN